MLFDVCEMRSEIKRVLWVECLIVRKGVFFFLKKKKVKGVGRPKYNFLFPYHPQESNPNFNRDYSCTATDQGLWG